MCSMVSPLELTHVHTHAQATNENDYTYINNLSKVSIEDGTYHSISTISIPLV